MIRITMTGLAIALVAIGCNCSSPCVEQKQGVDAGPYKLSTEPAGAKGVIAVRKEAQDGDSVVVAGRIGGMSTPLTDGRAVFVMVDPSLKPAMECSCPWDYCDTPEDDLKAATTTVKMVDEGGKPLAAGAKELFGVKELTTVVVTGTAKRDKDGNLTILARGLFVRPEQP